MAAWLAVTVSAATTITLQSSAGSPTLGQAVKLTATVSPSSATGGVAFYDGVVVLGMAKLSGGQAALTTSLLSAGSHSLKALYIGDAANAASTSAPLSLTVTTIPGRGFHVLNNPNIQYQPFSIVTADFNGDGIADLATDSILTTKFGITAVQVSVLLGKGDGTFQAPLLYTPSKPDQLTLGGAFLLAGDFNGDGRADLAYAVRGDARIVILLGNGDGTFQDGVGYTLDNSGYVDAVALGDFNGDGLPDLVWSAHTADSVTKYGILPGKSDGTFQPSVAIAAPASGPIAVADINADGRADLVIAGSANTVYVLLGKGDGTFQAPAAYTVSGAAIALFAGDFNGDGRQDLVVAGSATSSQGITVSTLLGKGDGTFQPATGVSTGFITLDGMGVGDFNGDGRMDLAMISGPLYVLLGNGDGTFQPPLNQACYVYGPLTVGDFNADGRADVATLPKTMLGVATPPAPDIAGVLDNASLPVIVPGSWITIQGNAFTSANDTWDHSVINGKLPVSLDGVGATIGGQSAFIQAVSGCQMTVQAPVVSSGPAQLTVFNSSGTSAPFTVTVQAYGPSLYTSSSPIVLATRPDYTQVTTDSPAKPGDVIVLWGTGFGPTVPAAPSGVPVPADRLYAVPDGVQVWLNSALIPVLGVALTPGFAGLYQVAIQIPSSTPDGYYMLQAGIGGVLSPNWYTLRVHQ